MIHLGVVELPQTSHPSIMIGHPIDDAQNLDVGTLPEVGPLAGASVIGKQIYRSASSRSGRNSANDKEGVTGHAIVSLPSVHWTAYSTRTLDISSKRFLECKIVFIRSFKSDHSTQLLCLSI